MSKSINIKIRRTMILNNSKCEFYHPNVPRDEQILSATYYPEKKEIIVHLFTDKVKLI